MIMIAALALVHGCGSRSPEDELSEFVTAHVAKVEPLSTDLAETHWRACATGDEDAYRRWADLRLQMRTVYSNRDEFAMLKRLRDSGRVRDPLLARQLTILYNGYLENQIDTTLIRQMVDLSTSIENRFNTYRGQIDGREVSSNDILDILRTETDSRRRRGAWLASKQVGEAVSAEVLDLVRLRNQAARELGFPDYYVMQLTLGEQDPDQIARLFDELKAQTDEPFRRVKAEIDAVLAERYGVKPGDLRPWHYQDPFFQESPKVYEVDLDHYYGRVDVKALASSFFVGIDLDPADILNRSDLYEREKKYPHAFSTDIDRRGDCRIMVNLRNNEYWTDTILHELGHATYSSHVDPSLPWLLRSEAHTFTTEAIAMLFGRLARNADWMEKMDVITAAEREKLEPISRRASRVAQIVFARWCQVMVRFERALYEDPEQDLNALWWRLVEENQYVHPPEGRDKPDWAAKIHIATVPAYYHNYMLGEVLASQLAAYVQTHVVQAPEGRVFSPAGHPEVGRYLNDKVFQPAARYRWDEMIERATGEPLTARYFSEEFVSS